MCPSERFSFLIVSILLLAASADATKTRMARQTPGEACGAPTDLKLCEFVDCLNGGTCQDDRSIEDCYRCTCPPGFTGVNCEQEITIIPGVCSPLCQNGGTCVSGVCSCPPGFAGASCEIQDICIPNNPCLNGGACSSNTCKCAIAYTGQFCETRDYCLPTNPCQNGGRCTSNVNGHTCDCSNTGFTGPTCSNPITIPNPCAGITCQNGGQCVLLPTNTYGCQCTAQFTGNRCETSIVATHICVTSPTNPCRNGGTCTMNGVDYLCACAAGFTGRNCETNEVPTTCTPNPCLPNGQCIQAVTETGPVAFCNCANGWTGRFCNVNLNEECTARYCENGGTCRVVANTRVCDCPPAFTGQRCESLVGGVTTTTTPTTTTTTSSIGPNTNCLSRPCQNGGSCFDTGNSFFCACTPQWTGTTCTTMRLPTTTTTTTTTTGGPTGNGCSPNPCLNGATCYNTGNTYFCGCTAQWTGVTCNTLKVTTTSTSTLAPSVNPCAANPCLNGGTCYRNGNGFVCVCTSQFTGEVCSTVKVTTTTSSTNTNLTCANRPCLNGGSCFNTGNSYFCYCGSAHTGKNCESVANCPLNCSPGTCFATGNTQAPYACQCSGVVRPTSCV